MQSAKPVVESCEAAVARENAKWVALSAVRSYLSSYGMQLSWEEETAFMESVELGLPRG